MTFLSLILLHQMSIAMTMGESSYTAILLFGSDKPHVRSISLRRKVRPGTTTEHDKLSRPIRYCRSFNVVDSLWNIFSNANLVLFDLVNR